VLLEPLVLFIMEKYSVITPLAIPDLKIS